MKVAIYESEIIITGIVDDPLYCEDYEYAVEVPDELVAEYKETLKNLITLSNNLERIRDEARNIRSN